MCTNRLIFSKWTFYQLVLSGSIPSHGVNVDILIVSTHIIILCEAAWAIGGIGL